LVALVAQNVTRKSPQIGGKTTNYASAISGMSNLEEGYAKLKDKNFNFLNF